MHNLNESITSRIKSFIHRAGWLLVLLVAISSTNLIQAASCNSDFCTLDMNSRIFINNNVWGVDNYAPGQYSSSITTLGANSWRTDFNLPDIGGGVKVYNSAVLGWHFGWHFPTGTGLATQLSANQNVNTTYSYTANFGGGTANVAYDCWLHTISNPTYGAAPNAPTDEIMIWVNTTGGAGALGSYIAMGISVGGSTWNLKRGNIGWEVWSFVRTSNSGSGSLNIKDFTDYLRNNYGLSSSKYLTSVQFGTEVFHGVGNLTVNNYTCTVGGVGCTPTAITPFVQINTGAWTQTASASATAGATVRFGPQPSSGGSWSWTGPNGFTATTREITLNNVQTSLAGTYVATYTNPGGCNSSQNFTLTVSGGGQIIANGTYRISPRHATAQALDVNGHGTADGSNVQQWTYGGGNNQRWTLTHLGNNVYQIMGVESAKALEVASTSTANGVNVDIRTYTGASNQRWTISATSGGYYRLTPVSSSGSALDVNGASTANGANVQQWTYGGANNQQWTFQTP